MEPLHENPVCTELEAIGRVRARAATVLDVTTLTADKWASHRAR